MISVSKTDLFIGIRSVQMEGDGRVILAEDGKYGFVPKSEIDSNGKRVAAKTGGVLTTVIVEPKITVLRL